MKQTKKSISITIDTEVYNKIAVLSKQDYRSVSSYINKILKDTLRKKNK